MMVSIVPFPFVPRLFGWGWCLFPHRPGPVEASPWPRAGSSRVLGAFCSHVPVLNAAWGEQGVSIPESTSPVMDREQTALGCQGVCAPTVEAAAA